MRDGEKNGGILHTSWIKRIGGALRSEPENKEQLIQSLRVARKHSLLDNNALSMMEGVPHVSEMRETVDIGRYRFKGLRVDSRTIHLLNIRLLPFGEDGAD